MNEPAGMPAPQPPKKSNTWLIVAIVVIVLCCCCVGGLVALYYGYDSLGDPLGIYSVLPRLVRSLAM